MCNFAATRDYDRAHQLLYPMFRSFVHDAVFVADVSSHRVKPPVERLDRLVVVWQRNNPLAQNLDLASYNRTDDRCANALKWAFRADVRGHLSHNCNYRI